MTVGGQAGSGLEGGTGSVGAIVVVESVTGNVAKRQASWNNIASTHGLAATPLCCLEVLGRSALQRTIAQLRQAGIQTITVVADDILSVHVPQDTARLVAPYRNGGPPDCWPAADVVFSEYAQGGMGVILLVRLGAYVESDVADFLRFQRAQDAGVIRAYRKDRALDWWCIDADSARGATLRSLISLPRHALATWFPLQGYVNDLATTRDFRRLAVDGLHLRCALRPCAREVRPGVWIDDSAQVDRGARIVAPAFIGAQARVCNASVVTRASALERRAHVDYGTVVEDASILPDTYLGAGLDVAHALVHGSHLVDLRRNLDLEILDHRLIGTVSPANRSARSRAGMYLTAVRNRWTALRNPRAGMLGR